MKALFFVQVSFESRRVKPPFGLMVLDFAGKYRARRVREILEEKDEQFDEEPDSSSLVPAGSARRSRRSSS